jgi:predicted AAA+ superfamily ATPase
MIERRITTVELAQLLNSVPAVALLGPRQVGKTTLALTVAERRPSIYLDLESDADRARLAEPELFIWRSIRTNWSFWMKSIVCRDCSRVCAD